MYNPRLFCMLAASLILVLGNTSFQLFPKGKNGLLADSADVLQKRLAIEKQIANSLRKNQEADGTYLLSHKFVDLNGDGKMEVITSDTEVSGNGWGLFYVFSVSPIRLLLRMEGPPSYEILKTSTRGFRDLKGLYRQGTSSIYKWDGYQYQQTPEEGWHGPR